ncbi:MAG: hypothetical protein P8L22_03920 [Acidimicrobiales bacterium]|nr:hypothetical protein [Acidimicrobiales bacterium]
MGRILSPITRVLGTFLFVLLLSCCSSDTQQSRSETSPAGQNSEPASLQAVDGTSVVFGDFGGQPTVLWFWAPN